jgi:hypothetical protein
MRLAPFNPFLICLHLSIFPLPGPRGPSPFSSSTHRLPRVLLFPCQSLAKSKPIISRFLPLPPVALRHVFSSDIPLTPRHFMPRPHEAGATTPIMRPIFRAGHHAFSSGRSANPGGSTRGLPRPKGAELAGPFSIPMK